MCRFYLLLAGAVEERQGISIPYPSPTPLLTPGGIRCGGAFWLPRLRLPRLTGIQDSGIRCRFLIPTSIYRLGALCSALYRSRFSRGAQLGTFVFHYWGVDRSFLRLRRGWAIIFRRICADREWIVNMADEGEENQTITFTSNQYGTVSYHCIGNYIPQSLPVEGGCSRSRSRTIYIGNGSLTLGSTRTCTN